MKDHKFCLFELLARVRRYVNVAAAYSLLWTFQYLNCESVHSTWLNSVWGGILSEFPLTSSVLNTIYGTLSETKLLSVLTQLP